MTDQFKIQDRVRLKEAPWIVATVIEVWGLLAGGTIEIQWENGAGQVIRARFLPDELEFVP